MNKLAVAARLDQPAHDSLRGGTHAATHSTTAVRRKRADSAAARAGSPLSEPAPQLELQTLLPARLAQPPAAQASAGGDPAAAPARITTRMVGYDELITLLLLDPFRTQRELAKEIGYSESWLSRIISSDLFQTKLRERLATDVEPERRAAIAVRFGEIEERAKASLSRALELIEQKLERPVEEVDPKLVLEAGKFAAQLAGYGGRSERDTAPVQVNMNVHLQDLAGNMTKLFRSTRADAEPPSRPRLAATRTPLTIDSTQASEASHDNV